MNYIVTVSDSRFSLNGIDYLKNYITKVIGNRIIIFNCYENNDVLLPLTVFSDITLNGVVYNSAALLQHAILDVLFIRGMGNPGSGAAVEIGRSYFVTKPLTDVGVHYENAINVVVIERRYGIASMSYNVNGGAFVAAVAPIAIPENADVVWRIVYSSGSTRALFYLNF